MKSYFNFQIMNGHVLNIGATPVHFESCGIPEGTLQLLVSLILQNTAERQILCQLGLARFHPFPALLL